MKGFSMSCASDVETHFVVQLSDGAGGYHRDYFRLEASQLPGTVRLDPVRGGKLLGSLV